MNTTRILMIVLFHVDDILHLVISFMSIDWYSRLGLILSKNRKGNERQDTFCMQWVRHLITKPCILIHLPHKGSRLSFVR